MDPKIEQKFQEFANSDPYYSELLATKQDKEKLFEYLSSYMVLRNWHLQDCERQPFAQL